jgi:hypothetical protein
MRVGFFASAVSVCVSSFAAVGVFAAPAMAQAVEFRGTATVTAKNKACTAEGWVVGLKEKPGMRYRPPKVGDNGKPTKIAFFYNYWGTSFELEKGNLGSSYKPVAAFGMSASPYAYGNGAEVRVTSLSPSKITADTSTVKIKGEIRGFDDIPGCVVTFSAKLKPR